MTRRVEEWLGNDHDACEMRQKQQYLRPKNDSVTPNVLGMMFTYLRPAMLSIEIDREEDGRWIGEVPELPGVLAYGATESEAKAKAIALAFHVIADRIEHGETTPINVRDYFVAA